MPRTSTRIAMAGGAAVALALALGPEPARAGELQVVGSDTMAPLLRSWSRALGAGEPPLELRVEGKGSSTGPPALLVGRARVASMTRRLNAAERRAFEQRGESGPLEIPIAYDAVAVYVNERNPVERLTLNELDAVFSRTRRCGAEKTPRTWGELGAEGEYASRTMTLYGRASGSGTRTFFREVALCDGRFRQQVRQCPGARSCALAIAEEPFSMAYGNHGDLIPRIKALALAPRPGAAYVRPERDAIYDGRYPLARRLYLYVMGDVAGDVAAMLRFALSDVGQALVEEAGYLRVPPDEARSTLARLGPAQ